MDSSFEQKTRALFDHSKTVIRECGLPNGAIVAANSDLPRYPVEAKAYRYVWPRDAAYVCVAADAAGVTDIQEPFFTWCAERALRCEDVFRENYHTNGQPSGQSGFHQLDQTGAVLWAIHEHVRGERPEDDRIASLIARLADGLCAVWEQDHFTIPCTDLWEERTAYPDLAQNHLYTLAACSHGLKCAAELFEREPWRQAAAEMGDVIHSVEEAVFARTTGDLADDGIDACLLGLLWPFEAVGAKDRKMQGTLEAIEERLSKNGGIHRYEADAYDGWTYRGIDRKTGAGAWPLLNFWMSIVHAKRGDKKKARSCFDWVVERVEDDIPEQLFENNLQQSPKPLAWSHAMCLLACTELDSNQE